MCICEIEVVTLFLILTLDVMMAMEEDEKDFKTISLLQTLNEIQSEKLSITLSPGENSELRGIKDGKYLLDLLVMSTKWPLTSKHYWMIRELRTTALRFKEVLCYEFMREYIRWLEGSLWAHSCDLLPSFWRWSLMGTSPMIALILYKGEVLKAPNIYIAALLCIFPRAFKWYAIRVWL